MNELVTITQGTARASSRTVAEMFEKQHQHVLRSIDALIAAEPELQINFVLQIEHYEAGHGAKRDARYYEMDRKGFALLAMGFTGARALEWKIRFIDAFDRLEAAVGAGLAPGGGVLGNPDAIDRMKVALALVREARVIFGRTGAKRLWGKMGLPDCVGVEQDARLGRNYDVARLDEGVMQWQATRLRHGGSDVRVKVSDLYADYVAWCEANRRSPLPITSFGRQLGGAGLQTRHSNGAWLDGYQLAA